MGNKKKLISKGLVDLFPRNINTFIDLFSGSAIVSMNVKANTYVLNDTNKHLIELYDMFKRYSAEEIIEHIEKQIKRYELAQERTKRNEFKDKGKIEKYKSAYMRLRNEYNVSHQVTDFYTLMFYSFSQQFRFNNNGEFNMPCGNDCFTNKNKEYIKNGVDFFQSKKIQMFSCSFNKLNLNKCKENDFVYLDPPYLNTNAMYNEKNRDIEYWNEKSEQDLHTLCETLNQKGIKWGMSNVFANKGFDNQVLKEWCSKNDWSVYTFDTHTYVACGKGNSNAKEVYICNYNLPLSPYYN